MNIAVYKESCILDTQRNAGRPGGT